MDPALPIRSHASLAPCTPNTGTTGCHCVSQGQNQWRCTSKGDVRRKGWALSLTRVYQSATQSFTDSGYFVRFAMLPCSLATPQWPCPSGCRRSRQTCKWERQHPTEVFQCTINEAASLHVRDELALQGKGREGKPRETLRWRAEIGLEARVGRIWAANAKPAIHLSPALNCISGRKARDMLRMCRT